MMNWIDIETTGLDPKTGYMLEVGLIVTDDKLVEIKREAFVIAPEAPVDVVMGLSNDFVKKMHTDSGLWEDLRLPVLHSRKDVEQLLITSIVQGAPLCGNSVHFDRMWLRSRVPALEDALHYRNVDVSTVKELYKRFSIDNTEFEKPGANHRVLGDLEASIAELRFYLERMGWGDLV